MNQFFIIATDDCMRNKLDFGVFLSLLDVIALWLMFRTCSAQVMMLNVECWTLLTTRSLVQCDVMFDVPRQLCPG